MKHILLVAALALFTFNTHAENLVVDAKIKEVGSTNWNERVFYIVLEGGNGLALTRPLISQRNMPNPPLPMPKCTAWL